MKIIWQVAARRKLKEILDYISEDSPNRAIEYIEDLQKRTEGILLFPEIGMVYHVAGNRIIRRLIIGKTKSVFYRVEKDTIYILTIRDNRQDQK
jgi:plasmid stabilization system protein ParE